VACHAGEKPRVRKYLLEDRRATDTGRGSGVRPTALLTCMLLNHGYKRIVLLPTEVQLSMHGVIHSHVRATAAHFVCSPNNHWSIRTGMRANT
jgi:hypothetical protein